MPASATCANRWRWAGSTFSNRRVRPCLRTIRRPDSGAVGIRRWEWPHPPRCVESDVELDAALRKRTPQRQGEEDLFRHALMPSRQSLPGLAGRPSTMRHQCRPGLVYLSAGVTELGTFWPFRSKDPDLVAAIFLLDPLRRRFKSKLLRSEPRSPVAAGGLAARRIGGPGSVGRHRATQNGALNCLSGQTIESRGSDFMAVCR